jgi:hypothetical protein
MRHAHGIARREGDGARLSAHHLPLTAQEQATDS